MSTFVNYLKDETPLEVRINGLFEELKVSPDDRQAIRSFLAPLREKGPVYRFHYEHTLRVALLCTDVAKFVHLDHKALFYAGMLHDIGKAQVLVETLGKTSGWTPKDSKAMEPHVIDGYRLIRGRFDFTADVILWHHKFQRNGYPRKRPRPLHPYCLGTKTMIMLFGRLLSLCDQFDAFHRVNDKQGLVTIPTGEEIREFMFRANLDQKVLLEQLYEMEIFTTHIEPAKAIAS